MSITHLKVDNCNGKCNSSASPSRNKGIVTPLLRDMDMVDKDEQNLVQPTGDVENERRVLISYCFSYKYPFPVGWKAYLSYFAILLALCASSAIFGFNLANTQQVDDNTEELNNEKDEQLLMCQDKLNNNLKQTLSYANILSDIHESFVNRIGSQPTPWLRPYYQGQVYSGSTKDQKLFKDLVDHLENMGIFDEVKVQNYSVVISLPQAVSVLEIFNRTASNKDMIINSNQKILGLMESNIIPPFVAYSNSGSVQGEMVNINYGTDSDFEAVLDAGVVLNNRIAIIRFLGNKATVEPLVNKVRRAEEHNLTAVLVYIETDNCSDDVPYYTLNTAGDLQTQGYAALDGVYRRPLSDLGLPTIPVQTIACSTAHRLLDHISGQVAPQDWQGKFNGSLRMGRKSDKADSWFVKLETTNQNQEVIVQNVLATIHGFISPEQTIMIGASRNSFASGLQREHVSTDALLKLVSPLEETININRWLPKRSLTFSFWGGAEFGDIGRTEYMEALDQLSLDNILTYIDLDIPEGALLSHVSVVTPDVLKDFVGSVINRRVTALKDDNANEDGSYDTDDEDIVGSGFDVHDPLIETYQTMTYLDPEDLPQLPWTSIPLIQTPLAYKTMPVLGSLEQQEMVRLQAALMLALADQNIIQYDNAATAKTIKADIHKLLRQMPDLQDSMKESLKLQADRLYNMTVIFKRMVDSMFDYSDYDKVNTMNAVTIQLNSQLSAIQAATYSLTLLKTRKGHSDLDLTPDDHLYSAATMQELSKVIVSMNSAGHLMKIVHFQIFVAGNSNTTSVDVIDGDINME